MKLHVKSLSMLAIVVFSLFAGPAYSKSFVKDGRVVQHVTYLAVGKSCSQICADKRDGCYMFAKDNKARNECTSVYASCLQVCATP